MKNKKNYGKDIDLLTDDLKILEGHIEDLWHFLPIPICLVNPAFNIINASKTLEGISGFLEIGIIGENLTNFLENFEEIKKELARNKVISNKETFFLTKERRKIIVSLSAETREDEKGDITGHLFAFIDMSEIKEKEKELQNKIKEMEKFNKLAIGREIKMVELKKEIERLKKEIGKRED